MILSATSFWGVISEELIVTGLKLPQRSGFERRDASLRKKTRFGGALIEAGRGASHSLDRLEEIVMSLSIARNPEGPSFLTLKQLAARYAVSRRTLERKIVSGDFPRPLKIGRASRWSPEDLEAYENQLRGERKGGA